MVQQTQPVDMSEDLFEKDRAIPNRDTFKRAPHRGGKGFGPEFVSFFRRHWDSLLLSFCVLILSGCFVQSLRLEPTQQLALKTAEPPEWVVRVMDKPSPGTLETEGLLSGASEDSDTSSEKPARTFHKAAAKKQAAIPIVNINQASNSLLCALPGIGPKMAERILAYRKAHGPFANIEALQDVKGIGPKKFEKLRPYLKL